MQRKGVVSDANRKRMTNPTDEVIHHGRYYADWLKRVGVSQRRLADAIHMSPGGLNKVLRVDAFILPERRAVIEAFIRPEAESRGMTFPSLLSDAQRSEFMPGEETGQEVQFSTKVTPPKRETIILTFEDGELIDMKKPESESETRAMLAGLHTAMKDVVEQIAFMQAQMAEIQSKT